MDLEQITHSAPVGRERGLWDARIVAAGQTVQGWIDELAPDTARFISEAPLPEETSFELSLTLASGLPSPVRVEARGMVQYSVLSGRRFRTELHLTEITQQRQVYLDYLQHDRTVYFQTDSLQSVRWKAFLTPSNDVREESAVFGWVIVVEKDTETKEVVSVYPAKTSYRGFSREDEEKGFIGLTKYLAENAKKLEENTNA